MGRTPTKAFDHVETFEDLSDTIFKMLLDYPHANYMDDASLQESILLHAKMTEA